MKLAFPTDEHFPYQDDRARSVALQIVRDFKPDIRITGSDGMDFYNVSKYDKNPMRIKAGLQDEIDAWQAGQREWRDAAPKATPFYLLGNHEDRLRRYLWNHPELYGLEALTIPNLLNFPSLGIEWKGESFHEELDLDSVVVKHGSLVRKHSAYTARGELENEFYSISVMTGHTHRGGTHYARTRRGPVTAVECFCLCGLNPEYVKSPNWQHGIVLATIQNHIPLPSIESIPFYPAGNKIAAVWRGKEYISE